jgi:hypothetical protein
LCIVFHVNSISLICAVSCHVTYVISASENTDQATAMLGYHVVLVAAVVVITTCIIIIIIVIY